VARSVAGATISEYASAMTQGLYILLAISAGLGSAMQTALLGSLSRERGTFEASFISALASVGGLAFVLGLRTRESSPSLPSPFDTILPFAGIALISALSLFFAVRGVPSYLAITGLFGFYYLFCASLVAPRVGIALFTASITAGTMIGAIMLDHYGAFGATVQRLDGLKVLGVAALLFGVFLIRGR
jgi:transporter family-2 protein